MELKPCPFCGGKAIIRETMAYLDEAVIACCSKCHARQAEILIDHPRVMPGPNGECLLDESTRYSRERAEEVAAKKWNRRARKLIEEAPVVYAVEVDAVRAWLYEIAINNTDNYLSDACEEIISRLDGLRVFARERRDNETV